MARFPLLQADQLDNLIVLAVNLEKVKHFPISISLAPERGINMNRPNLHIISLILIMFMIGNTKSFAGPAVDAFSTCLVMNTTGKERIALVKWIVRAFSAHPALSSVVTFDPKVMDETDRDVAKLFMDLIVDRCQAEAKRAVEAEGDSAFRSAFTVLGEVASNELTVSDEVNAAMGGFLKYLDEARLKKALE